MPKFKISLAGDNISEEDHSNKVAPRFKFDWTVDVISNGIPETVPPKVFVQKITRTTVKVEIEEIWGLNDVEYAPGRRTYSPIEMTIVELEDDSEYNSLYKIFKRLYGGNDDKRARSMQDAKNMTIVATHHGDNKPVKYYYYNCFIYEIKPEEFTYEDNNYLRFTVSIRFDNYDVN